MKSNQPTTQNSSRRSLCSSYFFVFFLLSFIIPPSVSCLAADFSGKLKSVTITDSAKTNSPPTAVINYSLDGDTVNFNANESSDPDGNVVSYSWDFGDETTGNGATVSHKFINKNPSITLTVIDDKGGVALTQVVIGTSAESWTLKYVDSEELVGVDGAATNAFDDDPATLWATEWRDKDPVHPHQIQIDLGAIYAINGMRYLPRQDGGQNGTIAKYEFYVSTDGTNWGAPVAQGTFARNTIEKEALFPTVNGQFIRLVALTEINGKPWTTVAELNILHQ